jgi:hypothetical protein
MEVNDLLLAQRHFRLRQWDSCLLQCTKILEKTPFDQVRLVCAG